jgi:hypothetical protein
MRTSASADAHECPTHSVSFRTQGTLSVTDPWTASRTAIARGDRCASSVCGSGTGDGKPIFEVISGTALRLQALVT